MIVEQNVFRDGMWEPATPSAASAACLALVFASPALIAKAEIWAEMKRRMPQARIVACTTSGEIAGASVQDETLVCSAITLQKSQCQVVSARLDEAADSGRLGAVLADRLPRTGLVHVLVLSEGLKVNGSALVASMVARLPTNVAVTGGLAGDGARFSHTAVMVDGPGDVAQVVAIGFYGDALRIGHGCVGGWDAFGIERCITKSEGNVLWELDGEPVLDLYKRYLGDHAAQLPASGLLFPLAIRPTGSEAIPVVRTILAVDESNKTLTFAGDVPERYRARLMRANVERLVDGAEQAGAHARAGMGEAEASFAILISCVGRKLVLKQRVEEEVEAVGHALGPQAVLAGFYSYGELSPSGRSESCELHNQTMTVTTFAEI